MIACYIRIIYILIGIDSSENFYEAPFLRCGSKNFSRGRGRKILLSKHLTYT